MSGFRVPLGAPLPSFPERDPVYRFLPVTCEAPVRSVDPCSAAIRSLRCSSVPTSVQETLDRRFWSWCQWVCRTGPTSIAWRSHVRQKRTDQRNVFWDRLVWALDQCSDQDADIYSVNMGMVVLTSLAKDSLMTAEDIEMIEQVNDIVVDRFSGFPPGEDEELTDSEATPTQQ